MNADDHNEALQRLESLFEEQDAFAILTALSLGSFYELPSRRNRLDGRLPSFVVEYAHGFAARRPLRGGSAGGSPLLMEELSEVTETACAKDLASKSVLRNVGNSEEADAKAQQKLRIWQIFSHDPGRPENERARFRAALDPFAEELEERLGFNAAHADAALYAIDALTFAGLAECFGFEPDEMEHLRERLAQKIRVGDALKMVPPDLGERVSCDPETLSAIAAAMGFSLPEENLRVFLNRFSLGFGDIAADRDPVRALWDVRERPLLRNEDRYLWTVPYNLAFAIRPVCERALREAGGDIPARYDKAKAQALEAEALKELHNDLMVDGSWRTLIYPHAEHEDQEVEGDGLVLLDSVALAVECKAVELSPSARQGSAKALAKKLQDALVKGAEQGQRTREALLGGEDITGVVLWEQEREPIAPAHLSRVLPIVVILEPLGAVTSALWQLIDPSEAQGPAPWIVNIDDLAWFDRELCMPARLLHYAVVRQRIAAAGQLGAVDEADWFLIYRSQGAAALYEKLELLSGLTAGYTNFVGTTGRRGSRLPGEPARMRCESLLIALHEARHTGWIEAALALLDLDEDADRLLADAIESGSREEDRWLTFPPMVANGSFLIAGIGDPDSMRDDLEQQVDEFREAALAAGAALICCVGIDKTSKEPALCHWRFADPNGAPA
jgi:hypothetical protein